MYTPKIHANWNFVSNFRYIKPIEIFVDRLPDTPKNNGVIRIIQIQESHNIRRIIDFIQNNQDKYDYVFTYLDELLKTNNKAIKFLCINTWIENYSYPNKKFGVSSLVGGKNFSELLGHSLRHELRKRQEEIKIKKYFFSSTHGTDNDADYNTNPILGDKKDPLFDTMFHIVIENNSINNMFTEKLIDCFQTKTIPIYWGAPNINEYFNIKGMFIAKNIDEIIYICNNLTKENYENMKQYIDENYNNSMAYLTHTQILDRKLNELFK